MLGREVSVSKWKHHKWKYKLLWRLRKEIHVLRFGLLCFDINISHIHKRNTEKFCSKIFSISNENLSITSWFSEVYKCFLHEMLSIKGF